VQFTPQLSEFSRAHSQSKKFRVVFASNDHSESQMMDYFKSMSFDLALPYNDANIGKLSARYKVRGIPSLVLVDAKTGALITTDARSHVSTDSSAARFPWKPKGTWDLIKAAKIVDHAGNKSDVTGVEYLGIYFSAHW
jgi:nucleoredoxin